MTLLRKKRIFYLLLSFLVIFCVFVLRIAWIQTNSALKSVTVGGKTINELAVRQREESIELDSGRGHFTDRNGVPLTGGLTWTPILFPIKEVPPVQKLNTLASLLNTTPLALRDIWSKLNKPYVWPEAGTSQIVSEKTKKDPMKLNSEEAEKFPHMNGIEVLPYVSRYMPGERGNQWLGYVAQRPDVIQKLRVEKRHPELSLTLQIGASGLEKTFDGLLRGNGGGVRAAYTVDGAKRPLEGIGTRIRADTSRYYPLQIRTTINEQIQRSIERLATEMHIQEGAVTVLDAATGDIVAMVSLPFYNPNEIDPSVSNWSNRAVKAAVPGSIFKTVIAAAALEEGVSSPKETFYCNGAYGKYGIACWKKGGHGSITLEEGFAKSCNVVFAALGERLNSESITAAASKLGLGRTVGWETASFLGGPPLKQLDQEEQGQVFYARTKADGGVRAQTALGQRDVLVSPLQAANLVVTLLHGGQVAAPRIVSEIRFKDGTLMASFPRQTAPLSAGQISPRTAKLLLSWMRRVVTDGTGQSLGKAQWPLAGKSGTAQVVHGGTTLNHQWFIGYGPTHNPKYALAVLVQNRPTESKHLAKELFWRVMDLLASASQK